MKRLKIEHALAMAKVMKERDQEVREAIIATQNADHGVVALRFSNQGTEMEIEILDEPYDDNVRVIPGDGS